MKKSFKVYILTIFIISLIVPMNTSISSASSLVTSAISLDEFYWGSTKEFYTTETETYRYNFSLTSANRIYVEFTSETGFLYAKLVNVNSGTTLATYVPKTHGEVWYSDEFDLYYGNYYLEVERKVSTSIPLEYSFKIHTKAYGVGPIQSERTGELSINRNNNESRYIEFDTQATFNRTFALPKAGVANITFTNNTGIHGDVVLFSKKGVVIDKSLFTDYESVTFENVHLEDVEYYLQINTAYSEIIFDYDVFIDYDEELFVAYSYPTKSIEIEVGKMKKITYNQQAYEGTEWTSTNELVASITPEGLITTHKEGTTTIKLKDEKDNDLITYNIIVVIKNTNKIQRLAINTSFINLDPNDKYQLFTSYIPANVTNINFEWNSLNEYVATVDSTGMITAHNTGSTIITVEDKVSGKIVGCQLVVGDIEVDFVGIKLNKKSIKIDHDDTFKLEATSFVTGGATGDIQWYSTDDDVAYVDSYGYVTGIAPGESVIIAYNNSASEENMAYCHVTVRNVYLVERIKLTATKRTMYTGEKFKLNGKALPVQAGIRKLKYQSSNPKVVKVDKKGKITALKKGNAVITVSSTDGSKVKAKATITVIQ